MTRPQQGGDDSWFLADICSVNKAGWAVEFRASDELIGCTFRRYGEVDVQQVSAIGKNHVDAYVEAKDSWQAFLSGEIGRGRR